MVGTRSICRATRRVVPAHGSSNHPNGTPAADVTAHAATIDVGRIAHELRHHEVTDVLVSGVERAAYSSDASLYRVLPRAIVRPRHTDDVLETLAVARSLGVPITVAQAQETGALGAALGAGVGVGAFSSYEDGIAAMTRARQEYLSNPERADFYARRYAAWRDLSLRLEGFGKDLHVES